MRAIKDTGAVFTWFVFGLFIGCGLIGGCIRFVEWVW